MQGSGHVRPNAQTEHSSGGAPVGGLHDAIEEVEVEQLVRADLRRPQVQVDLVVLRPLFL